MLNGRETLDPKDGDVVRDLEMSPHQVKDGSIPSAVFYKAKYSCSAVQYHSKSFQYKVFRIQRHNEKLQFQDLLDNSSIMLSRH